MVRKLVPIRSFFSKVVGVSHCNSDGSDRQKIISRCRVGERLVLEREPENEHDENAIAVLRAGSRAQIGYLNAGLAERLAPEMDTGKYFGAIISDLTGEDEQFHGVNIEITIYDIVDRPSKLWFVLRYLFQLAVRAARFAASAWQAYIWQGCDRTLRILAGDSAVFYAIYKIMLVATLAIAVALTVWLFL